MTLSNPRCPNCGCPLDMVADSTDLRSQRYNAHTDAQCIEQLGREHSSRAQQRRKRLLAIQREIQQAKQRKREYDHLLAEKRQLANDEAADLKEMLDLIGKQAKRHAAVDLPTRI